MNVAVAKNLRNSRNSSERIVMLEVFKEFKEFAAYSFNFNDRCENNEIKTLILIKIKALSL